MDFVFGQMASSLSQKIGWRTVIFGLLVILLVFCNLQVVDAGSLDLQELRNTEERIQSKKRPGCRCRPGNIRCLVTCGSSGDSSLIAIPFKRKYALMNNEEEFEEQQQENQKRNLDRTEDALDDVELLKNYAWLLMDTYEDFNQR